MVTGAVGGEEGKSCAVAQGDLGADERPHPDIVGGVIETRSAIKSVAITDGHRGQFEARSRSREIGRHRGAAQKTECAIGVEFVVGGGRQRRIGELENRPSYSFSFSFSRQRSGPLSLVFSLYLYVSSGGA